MLKLPTWTPHVDIHAVVLNFALRGSGSDGGDAQVSGVQVLLGPLPVIRLVVNVENSLLIKLIQHQRQEETEFKSNKYLNLTINNVFLKCKQKTLKTFTNDILEVLIDTCS